MPFWLKLAAWPKSGCFIFPKVALRWYLSSVPAHVQFRYRPSGDSEERAQEQKDERKMHMILGGLECAVLLFHWWVLMAFYGFTCMMLLLLLLLLSSLFVYLLLDCLFALLFYGICLFFVCVMLFSATVCFCLSNFCDLFLLFLLLYFCVCVCLCWFWLLACCLF